MFFNNLLASCPRHAIHHVRQLVAAGDRVIGTVLNASEASTVRSQVRAILRQPRLVQLEVLERLHAR